jgi:UDP-N-acetylmuramate dehydrogenase
VNALRKDEGGMALRRHEPMSRHVSWRVGGPADVFVEPCTVGELQDFLRGLAAATPVHWIGLGSNLLVRDGGIRGAVISTARLPRAVRRIGAGRVEASCSLPCATLARQCVRWGLGPASFFAGIPGSIGGALAMNAGAFGHETWELVSTVTTVDRGGGLHRRARNEYRVAYRVVEGPADEWFLGAELELTEAAAETVESIRSLLRRRKATQPLGQPSCGSVFRNPAGGYAGQLIEAAGLKGHQHGGARISEKHANFIVNLGAATAADIEWLIHHAQAVVKSKFAIDLEPEVRIVGETLPGAER